MYTSISSNNDQSSYFTRTSLDERIFALNGISELMSIKLLPRILGGIAHQTIKNQIGAGTFPFVIIPFNSRNHVRTEDVVRFIQSGKSIQKKVGRKTNEERARLAAEKEKK